MTDPLFRRALCLTDVHFGRGGNDPVALQDNLDFLVWAIDQGRSWGADLCLMLGDWHDNRNTIHIATLDASLTGMRLLNDFGRTIILPGNHDLHFRHSRSLSSIGQAELLPNIEIIHAPTIRGDVALLPWLIGDERQQVRHMNGRYGFAHMEVPGFKLNSQVEAGETSHSVSRDSFGSFEMVFSGHFHKRQRSGNICYMGSIMPFDFSDAWDDDRGIMLLEWGRDPVFRAWPEQPRFRTMTVSRLLDDAALVLGRNMTVRVTDDCGLSTPEAAALREHLMQDFALRRFELSNPPAAGDDKIGAFDVSQFRTVDQIVIDGLRQFERSGVAADRLVDIYKSLMSA